MSGDRGHPRAIRLLPFAAAAVRSGYGLAPLDPQDGGSEVITAQGVFFVFMPRSLTCGLFSLWCGVWSPRGPQGAACTGLFDVGL
jgi:hypothetical protein